MKIPLQTTICFLGWVWCNAAAPAQSSAENADSSALPQARLLSVEKIWDRAPHNGFTDLIRFRERFFCCFREGLDHVGGDGVIRILSSTDGKQWVNEGAIAEQGIDLREAKLTITPSGKQLCMLCGGSIFDANKKLVTRRTRISFSDDGRSWTPTRKLLADGDWLWQIAVNPGDRKFYGIADNVFPTTGGPPPEPHWSLKSYSSADGVGWQRESTLDVPGQPNQATLRFLRDGRAMALVRHDDNDRMGRIGVASAPFREWRWTPVSYRLAGPNFIELPGGMLIAGSRGFGKRAADSHVMLYRMHEAGLDPLLKLPSGGSDCGYPGFVWHDDVLWVTYNSSHEGRTNIYLARVGFGKTP